MAATITLNNISYGYLPQAPIIRNLSGSFSPGRFYSIIGPNGSGKTTLLDLISGFLHPDSGNVRIDGTDISGASKKMLSKKIAVVSQDYTINFPFQVTDVIMMGRHPHIPRFSQPGLRDLEIVDTVMEQCGIRHLGHRKITELSGGERQRCVFARALCQDTPVLILDEAFSNMDIRHTLHMLEQVKQRVKETNLLVISVFHDLNFASAWSDRLLMLKKGRIHAFGDSQEILTRDAIKTVFNVDAIVNFNPDIQKKQVSYPSI